MSLRGVKRRSNLLSPNLGDCFGLCPRNDNNSAILLAGNPIYFQEVLYYAVMPDYRVNAATPFLTASKKLFYENESYDYLSWVAPDSMEHTSKSMGCPQPEQVWDRSNSSENISFSLPQFGHLQVNDDKFLCA